jgi:hypothetical protein
VAVTGVTAYALFALAEVGLEIENVCIAFPFFSTFQLLGFHADWFCISHGAKDPMI